MPGSAAGALDLGKPVTIRAAGLLVTSVHSFESSTQVTLAAPAERTVEEGQADIWNTDSRPGLEQLLTSLKKRDVEAAEIRFGPGVYDFTRTPKPSRVEGAISLHGQKNLTIRGSGAGATVLRLMPHQDLDDGLDTHVIETQDCANLTLRDLSVAESSSRTTSFAVGRCSARTLTSSRFRATSWWSPLSQRGAGRSYGSLWRCSEAGAPCSSRATSWSTRRLPTLVSCRARRWSA